MPIPGMRTPKYPIMISLVAALTVSTVLSSCGAGSGNSGSAPPSLTQPAIPAAPPAPASDGSDIRMPLDAFSSTDAADEEVLKQANDVLVQRCMVQRGFTDTAPAPSSSTQPASGPRPEPYGVTDLATAREFGYGSAGRTANMASGGSSGVPTIDQLINEHGTAWVVAMFGAVPPAAPAKGAPQGCVDAGPAGLYDSAYGHIDRSIVGELADQATQHTEADPRVLTVERAWSSCLAKQGFSYDTPMLAAGQKRTTPASATEIATAVADVGCKQQTNLPGVWVAVESGYQQQLVNQNAAALDEFHQDYLGLLAKARALITAPSAPPTR